jgi:uncharacterized membrane protein YesL
MFLLTILNYCHLPSYWVEGLKYINVLYLLIEWHCPCDFIHVIINHCVLCCRVLYRQRFFQTVPKLVEHYHRAVEPVRCNFLIALAYMLQGVPRVVLTVSLPEVSYHLNVSYRYVRTVSMSWFCEFWGLHSSVAAVSGFEVCTVVLLQFQVLRFAQ